jgi:hypothetical protein
MLSWGAGVETHEPIRIPVLSSEQLALYAIAFGRMRRDQRTRDYVIRRAAEDASKKEIVRCLKRYIARELYRVLVLPSPRERPPVSVPCRA